VFRLRVWGKRAAHASSSVRPQIRQLILRGGKAICLIRCQGPTLFACVFSRWRENCEHREFEDEIATVKVATSPLAVGRVAISGVRIWEFTEQLSIIGGNREHNCRKTKSAEGRADPKHSHGKSPFELDLAEFLALRTAALV
jgi:hypothetical protein